MKAIFKENKKLVLNSADANEQLVLEEFIKKANSGNFNFTYNKLLDINGEVNGMAIELIRNKPVEVEEKPTEEPIDEQTEPSTPTENVEG